MGEGCERGGRGGWGGGGEWADVGRGIEADRWAGVSGGMKYGWGGHGGVWRGCGQSRARVRTHLHYGVHDEVAQLALGVVAAARDQLLEGVGYVLGRGVMGRDSEVVRER